MNCVMQCVWKKWVSEKIDVNYFNKLSFTGKVFSYAY